MVTGFVSDDMDAPFLQAIPIQEMPGKMEFKAPRVWAHLSKSIS